MLCNLIVASDLATGNGVHARTHGHEYSGDYSQQLESFVHGSVLHWVMVQRSSAKSISHIKYRLKTNT